MTPPTAVDIHAVTDTTTIALPDPLTVNDVSNRRAKAGKFLGGVAAFTMSDFFKDKERVSFISDYTNHIIRSPGCC